MKLDYDFTSRLYEAYARRLVPVECWDMRFTNSNLELEQHNPEAWEIVRTYQHGNLWICGPYGTGKSFASGCILNNALERNQTGAWLRGTELARSPFDDDFRRLVRNCTNVDCLVIEDLDKGAWSAPSVEALFMLMDSRWVRKRRSTIVTANISGRAFCDHLDSLGHGLSAGAVYDRFKPCRGVKFAGRSMRKDDDESTPAPTPANVQAFQTKKPDYGEWMPLAIEVKP